MAFRRPLIVNSSAGQIQELTDSDGLIGNGTIPVGGIIMWSGSIASIPTGWALCNGSSGTPDLRNRFVVGAGSVYSVAGVGGTADATLVSHTHSLSGGGLTGSTTFLTSASVSTNTEGVSGGGAAVVDGVNLSTSSGTVGYTNPTVSTQGSSATNANLPPYYALAYIMRVS